MRFLFCFVAILAVASDASAQRREHPDAVPMVSPAEVGRPVGEDGPAAGRGRGKRTRCHVRGPDHGDHSGGGRCGNECKTWWGRH